MRRSALPLLLSLPFLSVTGESARAQERSEAPRWALVPQVGLGGLGRRWEADFVSTDTAAPGTLHVEMGPGTSPLLGLGLQFAPGGRINYELLGGVIFTDYAFDLDNQIPGSDAQALKVRGAGKVRLFRLNGSALLRVRAGVPGYFTLGAGTIYYQPVRRVSLLGGSYEDEAQWMPSAHAGLGLDLTMEGHTLRLDGRLYGSRPGQDNVPFNGRPALEARGLVLDFLLSVGYLIRL